MEPPSASWVVVDAQEADSIMTRSDLRGIRTEERHYRENGPAPSSLPTINATVECDCGVAWRMVRPSGGWVVRILGDESCTVTPLSIPCPLLDWSVIHRRQFLSLRASAFRYS